MARKYTVKIEYPDGDGGTIRHTFKRVPAHHVEAIKDEVAAVRRGDKQRLVLTIKGETVTMSRDDLLNGFVR